MQRLGAIFIAVCMVAISTSVGAMLYFRFGLSIPEAAPVSFGVFLTLLLVHYQISRVRDRMLIEEQMDDLTRLKLALTKEVQDVRELAQRLEGEVDERVNRDIEPILAELDIIGSLVKQLAESCAELDERVQQGDEKVEAINATLKAAKDSVQELEGLLRSNSRPLSALSDRPSSVPSERQMDARSDFVSSASAPADQGSFDMDAKQAEEDANVSPEDETAVRRALALGQIEMFMQPIVTLPMRKPQYYEALARLQAEDGSLITPDIFLPVCRKNGFLPMLDRLAINETFRMQRRLADRGHMVDCFCNLALPSLADSDFFAQMRSLFEQNQDLAEHVILEFSLADMRNFGVLEDETLQLLRSMGFRFSVDRMGSLNADFDKFARKGVRFAKIAAPILTNRDAGRGLDIHPADFSRVLSRKGIDLIVTHVETESTLVGLIDYNIQLAQGDHFAAAKAVKGTGGTGEGGGASDIGKPSSNDISRSSQQASATPIRPSDIPPVRVHGQRQAGPVGNGQPSPAPTSETGGRQRRLGDNPRVAQALRAMAQRDGGSNSTRDHFRNVLAEAAGLMDEATPEKSTMGMPASNQRQSQPMSPSQDRLPATDDYGLKTSTSRGQFLDLSDEPVRQRPLREPQGEAETGTARSPTNFERLIR